MGPTIVLQRSSASTTVLNVSLESTRVRFLVAELWQRSDVKGWR